MLNPVECRWLQRFAGASGRLRGRNSRYGRVASRKLPVVLDAGLQDPATIIARYRIGSEPQQVEHEAQVGPPVIVECRTEIPLLAAAHVAVVQVYPGCAQADFPGAGAWFESGTHKLSLRIVKVLPRQEWPISR